MLWDLNSAPFALGINIFKVGIVMKHFSVAARDCFLYLRRSITSLFLANCIIRKNSNQKYEVVNSKAKMYSTKYNLTFTGKISYQKNANDKYDMGISKIEMGREKIYLTTKTIINIFKDVCFSSK